MAALSTRALQRAAVAVPGVVLGLVAAGVFLLVHPAAVTGVELWAGPSRHGQRVSVRVACKEFRAGVLGPAKPGQEVWLEQQGKQLAKARCDGAGFAILNLAPSALLSELSLVVPQAERNARRFSLPVSTWQSARWSELTKWDGKLQRVAVRGLPLKGRSEWGEFQLQEWAAILFTGKGPLPKPAELKISSNGITTPKLLAVQGGLRLKFRPVFPNFEITLSRKDTPEERWNGRFSARSQQFRLGHVQWGAPGKLQLQIESPLGRHGSYASILNAEGVYAQSHLQLAGEKRFGTKATWQVEVPEDGPLWLNLARSPGGDPKSALSFGIPSRQGVRPRGVLRGGDSRVFDGMSPVIEGVRRYEHKIGWLLGATLANGSFLEVLLLLRISARAKARLAARLGEDVSVEHKGSALQGFLLGLVSLGLALCGLALLFAFGLG